VNTRSIFFCGGLAVSLASGVALFVLPSSQPTPTRVVKASIGSVPVVLEVAETHEQRERGLMGRASLASGHGMIFVSASARPRSFWMKDTLIPLDILFFKGEPETGALVLDKWYSASPCLKDPCPRFGTVTPVKVVVELPAGTVQAAGWKMGETLSFTPSSLLK